MGFVLDDWIENTAEIGIVLKLGNGSLTEISVLGSVTKNFLRIAELDQKLNGSERMDQKWFLCSQHVRQDMAENPGFLSSTDSFD